MSKLNFFTPYLEKQEKSQALFRRFSTIGILIFALSLVAGGGIFINSYMIKQDIQSLQETLAQPDMIQKRAEMDSIKTRVRVGGSYLQEVKVIKERIQAVSVLKIELMDNISSALPSDVVMQTMELSVNDLRLTANSRTRDSIAEFEYNIKKTGLYGNVHINAIARAQGAAAYTFDLSGNYQR